MKDVTNAILEAVAQMEKEMETTTAKVIEIENIIESFFQKEHQLGNLDLILEFDFYLFVLFLFRFQS